jgi:hypothetical protein
VPVKRLAVAPVGPGSDASPHEPAAATPADEPTPVLAPARGHSAARLDEAFPGLAQALAFPWDKNADGWVDDQIALSARERRLRAVEAAEARARESARRDAAPSEPDVPVAAREQASYATATGPPGGGPPGPGAVRAGEATAREPERASAGPARQRYSAPAAAAGSPFPHYL